MTFTFYCQNPIHRYPKYSAASILRPPMMGLRTCGLILQVVLRPPMGLRKCGLIFQDEVVLK